MRLELVDERPKRVSLWIVLPHIVGETEEEAHERVVRKWAIEVSRDAMAEAAKPSDLLFSEAVAV
jgi:hypothetical protein